MYIFVQTCFCRHNVCNCGEVSVSHEFAIHVIAIPVYRVGQKSKSLLISERIAHQICASYSLFFSDLSAMHTDIF